MPKLLRKQELRDDPNDPITTARNISKLSLKDELKLAEEQRKIDEEEGNPYPLTFRVPEASKITNQDYESLINIFDSKAFAIENNLNKIDYLARSLFLEKEPEKKQELLLQIINEREELYRERDTIKAKIEDIKKIEKQRYLSKQEDADLSALEIEKELNNEVIIYKDNEIKSLVGAKTISGRKSDSAIELELFNTFTLTNNELSQLVNYYNANFKKAYNQNKMNQQDRYDIRTAVKELIDVFNDVFSNREFISELSILSRQRYVYIKLFNDMKKNLQKLEKEVFQGEGNKISSQFVGTLKGAGILPYTFIHHPQISDPRFRSNPRRYEL